MKVVTYTCDGCCREMDSIENHEITFYDTNTINLCGDCYSKMVHAIIREIEKLQSENVVNK